MAGLGPAGLINAQGVNTDFVEIGRTLFNGPDAFGPWRTWAGELPMDGVNLMGFMIGATGAVAEISGDRLWQQFRAYARTQPAKKYGPPGIEVEAIQVENDRSGAIRNRLMGYLASAKDGFGKPVQDFYVTNPTCIDGVALINGSHPFDSGGSTWTNDSSTALSAAELNVIVVAMSGRLDEFGVNLGIRPTHLMVAGNLEQIAMDITGADRAVGITTAANPALSGNTIAGGTLPNWFLKRGKLDVIVNQYMTAGTYAFMDLSKPDVRPIYFGVAKPFEAVVVDDPQSEPMKERSSYAYYAEGYMALLGGVPQCIYGKDT
jgi:hypothetical protein